MVNWKRVRLIFRRELVDQLRDRRTVGILLGLPVILYVVLGFGLSHLSSGDRGRRPTVVVLGAGIDAARGLLAAGDFDPRWRPAREVTDAFSVITDEHSETADPVARSVLQHATPLQEVMCGRAVDGADVQALAGEFLRVSDVDVVVLLMDMNSLIGAAVPSAAHILSAVQIKTSPVVPLIFFNSQRRSSLQTFGPVQQVLSGWQASLLDRELQTASFPPGYAQTFTPVPVDVAAPTSAQPFGNIWSLIVPPLIVMMSVIGAFYPAADLCAGERERGTLETLLVSPSSRLEIIVGKLAMVVLFSGLSTVLNMTSLGLIGQSALLSSGPPELAAALVSQLPPQSTLLWSALLLLPIILPICAVALALASFAESTKEAQFYLAPLMIVLGMLTAGCCLPGVTFSWSRAVIPVVGPVLLLKQLLATPAVRLDFPGFGLVLLTSCLATALPVWLATQRFQRGDLLYGSPPLWRVVRRWWQQVVLNRAHGTSRSAAETHRLPDRRQPRGPGGFDMPVDADRTEAA